MRASNLKNDTSELERLKHLLLEDELAQIEALASKLQTLEFESYDPETIKEKLLPLFDDLLLQKLQQKEARTLDILAEYLAQIITKSADQDLPSLSRSLQRVISPAIAKEIADNKDKMVDALYPIMGGMISKYVSNAIAEMMESINAKIEDGLSFERYKRKAKAKLTGVSESELLLEEAADAKIESLFVIQKDTGLLITEAHIEEKEIDDPYMVASMASAIKDFVNDWIEHNESPSEVQLLSYGNATLYIESAGSVYLIAFLDAEPDHEQRARINAFFATLIRNYSDFFQRFEGDDRAEEIQKIQEEMKHFLSGENPNLQEKGHDTARSNPAKYLFWLLALLILGYAGYSAKKRYDLYLLEQEISRKSGEHVTLEEESDRLVIRGDLNSLEGLYRVKKLLQEKSGKKIKDRTHLPVELLDRKISTLVQKQTILTQSEDSISSKVQEMSQALEKMEKQLSQLEKRYSQSNQKLAQVKSLADTRAYILQRLDNALGRDGLLQPDGSLDFSGKRLFEAGETVPKAEALSEMKAHFASYLSVLLGDPKIRPYIKGFVIEGYTDSSGDTEDNQILSLARAKAIQEALLSEPATEQYGVASMITAKGLGESRPVIINGKEDKEASRRIKLKFELNDKKIVDMIKRSAE